MHSKAFSSKRRYERPRWDNLKMNKCPFCGVDWLKMGNATFGNGLIVCKCDFKISEVKMSAIVSDKVNKSIEEYLDE